MPRLALVGNSHGAPYTKAGVRGDHPLMRALQSAFDASRRLEVNPSRRMLEMLTERHGGVTTTTGGIAVSSRVKSRGANDTREVSPDSLDASLVSALISRIHSTDWVAVPRTMGQHDTLKSSCLTVVPEQYARVGLMWGNTLFDPKTEGGELAAPDSIVMFFPDWTGKRQILVMPEIGLTLVLASDYMGEAKKGHLRKVMRWVKEGKMGLGVHAASKMIYVLDEEGRIKTKGFVLCGLSGTGKTSLSASTHGLEEPNGAFNHQDDFVALMPEEIETKDGRRTVVRIRGTEQGYYLKTEGWEDGDEDPLHEAALKKGVVFENVAVDAYGNLRFDDYTTHGTRNGRCVVDRRRIANNSGVIDNSFSFLDTIVLIYRDPFLPPIAVAASPEFGAAAFMALQSVVTSAASSKREEWGKPTFEAGANPFMSPYTPEGIAEEVGMFYDLIRAGRVNVVLINTGEVGFGKEGEPPVKITRSVSERVIGEFALGRIKFRESTRTLGLLVPEGSLEEFDPEKVIPGEVYEKKFPEAVQAKRKFVEQFEPHLQGERRGIIDAFYRAFKE
ncbi:phosphoenolpyruvate carboxykinase (ATP) [Candidatus Micrarchaeota archaeon]|nr:phosphoenolpyruvate carboxykinase (ATP) [Candidatus Micrarchaeota archaeon]